MKIIKADIADAETLSNITIQSKSHWDYSTEQINLWKEELSIRPAYLSTNSVYKLIVNNEIIGYYSFFSLSVTIVKLDNLFLNPRYIGKGYGKVLLLDFIKRIESMGYKKVSLDSDPNSESFYKHFGFAVIGKLESLIKNRFLPIMELEV